MKLNPPPPQEQPAQFQNLYHSLRTWLPSNSRYVKVVFFFGTYVEAERYILGNMQL